MYNIASYLVHAEVACSGNSRALQLGDLMSFDDDYYDQIEAMHDTQPPVERVIAEWNPRWTIRRKLRKLARAKRKALKAGTAYAASMQFELNIGIPTQNGWYSARLAISEREAEPIKLGITAFASKIGLSVDNVHVSSHGMTLSATAYETWGIVVYVS